MRRRYSQIKKNVKRFRSNVKVRAVIRNDSVDLVSTFSQKWTYNNVDFACSYKCFINDYREHFMLNIFPARLTRAQKRCIMYYKKVPLSKSCLLFA